MRRLVLVAGCVLAFSSCGDDEPDYTIPEGPSFEYREECAEWQARLNSGGLDEELRQGIENEVSTHC